MISLGTNTSCKSVIVVASGSTVCNFVDGDGIGGSEINLGSGSETNTREQCVELVVRTQPNANGVTYSGRSTGGNTCYAEFGATGTSGGTSWQTCIFGQGNINTPTI